MLVRRTPLKRKTPLRPRSLTRKGHERDADYLAFVHWCKCYLANGSAYECRGPIEADHAGDRAFGKKASDKTCIPLCRRHHRHRTGTINRDGHFRGWSKDQMHAWRMAAVRFHQTLYENCVRLGQTPWRRKVA